MRWQDEEYERLKKLTSLLGFEKTNDKNWFQWDLVKQGNEETTVIQVSKLGVKKEATYQCLIFHYEGKSLVTRVTKNVEDTFNWIRWKYFFEIELLKIKMENA